MSADHAHSDKRQNKREFATTHWSVVLTAGKGTISAREQRIPFAQAAHELGISENAVQVAAHRLRKRYRELLRREICQTVCESGEVDDEIRSLISALATK